ncbi:protease inhibitor I42 family protein [Leekyejoonella antrihumi]|uniref:Proteinase inhibitor I42 chagasin domain-containing protein n=1 Tax=Leekyejoonella antrihumi TaxID=1660198 RepID=A0A563E0V6_9MICO|nr:protease inhibitor I42 family protein [Leekyejoonella antrihumi]TWP35802.1 hypothetical protein FGL98_12390 [Leekyejoonella antrihumi]
MSALIEVRVGESFALPDLAEAGGTGYLWSIPQVPEAIRIVSSEHHQSEHAPAGASGVRRFVLQPMVSGTHNVVAELRRPWGSEARDRLTFEIHVV